MKTRQETLEAAGMAIELALSPFVRDRPAECVEALLANASSLVLALGYERVDSGAGQLIVDATEKAFKAINEHFDEHFQG